ncbi:hypothetical protein NPIL_349441 [Nephila pilipes]|uniref:Uncharacterized protein n=1 Tax=Nephila pilipes TaxID=299642 RepID=A0A8X6TIM6_NEPPI|nr:hypothetical protein NPIL_349441 [Nephila pilipes]
MGLVVAEDLRILNTKQLILNSEKCEENSIKNLLMNIIEERLEKNKEAEQERKKSELEKYYSFSKEEAYSREYPSKPYATKRSSPDSRFVKTNQTGSTSSFSRGDKLKTDNRS